jgi:hypothetical protein
VAGASLAVKLVATPLLVALVYLVERRFGHAVAGLVFGFPLTSSLATAFLAAEQGADFARDTVPGLFAGIATFGAFLLAYAHAAARGAAWPASVGLALAAYAPAAMGLGALGLGYWPAVGVAVAVLAAAVAGMPRGLGPSPPQPHGRWELPLRAAIATALVVGLTAAASSVGPTATGLLLLVPASTATVASFVLARAGPAATVRLLRGLAWGAFSFVAFFVVVGAAMATMPTALVFVLAGLAAVGCSGLTWRLGVSRQPSGEALA